LAALGGAPLLGQCWVRVSHSLLHVLDPNIAPGAATADSATGEGGKHEVVAQQREIDAGAGQDRPRRNQEGANHDRNM